MKANPRPVLAVALAMLALFATGCGDSEPGEAGQLPSRPADVHGTVTDVQRAQNGFITVMIDRGQACAVSTRLPEDARVFSETGDGRTDGTIDDVAVGQKVDAWVGAIAESCPEQTTAEAIVIVGAS